jgi:putative membrane protein
MIRFLIRLGINAVAIYAAIRLVGIQVESASWLAIVILALIFGLVNTLIAPILKFLTCPFILITLGLFTLLINTFLFWLTGLIGGLIGFGFRVDFIHAFLGALIVMIVNVVLSFIFKEELKPGH